MLSLQHLTLSLGSNVVLRDVSLDVEPKDAVCIVGEEGAGKSTLLKLLTRELLPEEGVIKIDGANLSQLPREVLRMYRTRIGYLDQNATLDITLTIKKNIALPLDLLGTPAAERDRAVTDLLKRFHLTGIADMLPNRVSKGERRLAALARTIANGPFILLLDEPFQGLSDEAAALAASMLQNMQKKGATIVLATAETRTAGFFKRARVVHLHRGKLTEETTSAPAQPPTKIRPEDVARVATAGLVERSAAVEPEPDVEPTPMPARTERAASTTSKKIRITSVGSL